MNSSMDLYRLQNRQREHDARYHSDIYGIGVKPRMSHYSFHYAKYLGKIASLLKGETEQSAGLEKVITDAFIITLAASEALNIDFKDATFPEQGTKSRKDVAQQLLYDLAIYHGGIGKALDSHDHLEKFDSGEEMRKNTKGIMGALLTAADGINLDLEAATFTRWKEVEAKRIL